MTRRNKIFAAIIGFVVMAAAASTAFLLPPSEPDLMTRSTKIVDLTSVDRSRSAWLDYQHFWLYGHDLLLATSAHAPSASLVTIDLNLKTVTPLTPLDRSLRIVMADSSYKWVSDVFPSPDRQEILFRFFPNRRPLFGACVLRRSDGQMIGSRLETAGFPVRWLADSRHWVEIAPGRMVVHSLDGSHPPRIIPIASRVMGGFFHYPHADKLDALLGRNPLVNETTYVDGKERNTYGVASADGTQVAWVHYDDDPLSRLPRLAAQIITAIGYRPRLRGDVEISRRDGTDRREVGTFALGTSALPMNGVLDLTWTPDGKCLIFEQQHMLYSVPATGNPTR